MPGVTYHIVPVGEEWAVRGEGEPAAPNIQPTQALAVARAWELAQDRDEAEVIVQRPDGMVQSTMRIVRSRPAIDLDEPDAEDARLRAEALRILPSYGRLRAIIGKFPPPPGDFDDEEMAC